MATSTRAKATTTPRTRYEDDLYTWVQEQVALLRAGKLSELDILNIAEELSDVAKAELRELVSSIAVLTQHLLKWEYQTNRRSRSWELSIREHRRRIARLLKKSPGLKAQLAEAVEDGYADGRDRALSETDLPDAAIPQSCPYTFDEMLTRPVAYEPQSKSKRDKR